MLSGVKLRNSKALVLFLALTLELGGAQVRRDFHRAFAVSLAEPVSLEVALLEGDLRIAYAHDGDVSISVAAENASGLELESLAMRLGMTQTGNHLKIRERPGPSTQHFKLSYTIDVPYRTELRASLQRGKQAITGIMGPVNAEAGIGDIDVSYVSLEVAAHAQAGNLNFEAVGGEIEARAGEGNIHCQRAPHGISAETQDGDISLMVVGPSTAVVKNGNGRIDVGGAHRSLVASTSAGDLHVKAVPHEDWQLRSKSGTIRVELPLAVGFDLDAATTSGGLIVARDDVARPDPEARRLSQKVNGGGARIEVRSKDGRIVIG